MSRRRKKRPVNRIGGKVIAAIIAMFFVLVAVLGGAAAMTAMSWVAGLPDEYDLNEYAMTGISRIYASDRETVLASMQLVNRIETKSDDISQHVKDATVATEDERFFEHDGYDLQGIVRALFVNLGGGQEGASTITQQLVRNTVLLDEMSDISYKRKVREIYIASKLEEKYSKDEILTLYLNIVNYGDGCYGIEAASRDYFGIPSKDLNISQAAMLAGIPQSPNANNPRHDYEKALARRDTVLSRMLRNGYISQAEFDQAMADRPELAPEGSMDDVVSDIAPHFVDYVKELLGTSSIISADRAALGGLDIYTTLDVRCQQAANDAIRDRLDYIGDPQLDASLTSVDPDNGNIVAMVGGKDYAASNFNLSTQMRRQAGSSFKTFALLAAINEGISPTSLYLDAYSPMEVTDEWTVTNSSTPSSDQINLEEATRLSINTTYAYLTHNMGAQKVVDIAHACGIKTPLDAVDSICLGSQGVNTLEMASAYATIAAEGVYHEPVAILEIADDSGNVLYKHEDDSGQRVMTPQVAYAAIRILEQVVSSGTGTGAQLYSGQVAAGKTGTSQEGRDLWFCGFTPQYSAAVWAGYQQESATPYWGGESTSPIWQQYMTKVLEDSKLEDFPEQDPPLYKHDWDFGSDTGNDSPYPSRSSSKNNYSYGYGSEDSYGGSSSYGYGTESVDVGDSTISGSPNSSDWDYEEPESDESESDDDGAETWSGLDAGSNGDSESDDDSGGEDIEVETF